MLAVSDVMAAVDWYTQNLDFELVGTWGDPVFYALIQNGDVRINFIASESAAGESGDRGGTYLVVDDVDALHSKLVEQGATVWGPPENRGYHMRDFVTLDNNGYRICCGEYEDVT